MGSLLNNIEDNLNNGDETIRVINSLSNTYNCKSIRLIEYKKKNLDSGGTSLKTEEKHLSEIWCSCIFNNELIKKINNTPKIIEEIAIYDDIHNIFKYNNISNISDYQKYFISQLLRIIYNNQSVIETINSVDINNFSSVNDYYTKFSIIDDQLNNEILPFINNDDKNSINNIILEIFYSKLDNTIVCINMNIPFAFKLHYENSSKPPIRHEGSLKLEFYNRDNPLIKI